MSNKNLTPEQENILHNEGTEPPGSSPLNQEKRVGDYFFIHTIIIVINTNISTI